MQTLLEQKVLRSLLLARAGNKPTEAWLKMLAETHRPEKLESQKKHSCPKWAFAALCHNGYIKGVAAGCCPESEGKNSGRLVIEALRQLRVNPSLSTNKTELKRRVYGEQGMPGYRTPNDEVEVLLFLQSELTV